MFKFLSHDEGSNLKFSNYFKILIESTNLRVISKDYDQFTDLLVFQLNNQISPYFYKSFSNQNLTIDISK